MLHILIQQVAFAFPIFYMYTSFHITQLYDSSRKFEEKKGNEMCSLLDKIRDSYLSIQE